MDLLCRNPKGLSIKYALAAALDLSQSVVSVHASTLRHVNLVRVQGGGPKRIFLASDEIRVLLYKAVDTLCGFTSPSGIDELKRRLLDAAALVADDQNEAVLQSEEVRTALTVLYLSIEKLLTT